MHGHLNVKQKTRLGESWRDDEHVYTTTKHHNDELCKLSRLIYKQFLGRCLACKRDLKHTRSLHKGAWS